MLARFPTRYLAITLTAVLGTVASAGVFLLALWSEYRVAENDFQNKAKNYLQTINDELQQASTLLYTLRGYFEANDRPVSRGEFMRFSSDLHDRVAGLRDIGWAPRVTHDAREAFERSVRASGAADFQVQEAGPAGKRIRAGDRSVYYPILYLDSGAVVQPVLGFDLASEPIRQKAIVRSIETRRPAATPPIKLITVKRPKGGVMSFISVGVEASGHSAPALGDKANGIVLGAIEIDVLMENVIKKRARLTGLDVYLFEPEGPPGNRLIYWRSSASQTQPAPAEAAVLAATHSEGRISLLDQEWGIVFTPTVKLDAVAWNWHAIMPLAVGLMMTGLIVAYLLSSLRRTVELERLTFELRRSTDDLQRNAEKINHMARHDALTGLPNRAFFNERMDIAAASLQRGVPFAVLCLDLDRFKAVNDSLGHGAGDQLLVEVAERLRSCVREVDTVARLGGDEFAVIMSNTSSTHQAQQMSMRLIDALGKGYELDGSSAVIGVSIGIAMAPGNGMSTELVLSRADLALYAAKAAGRGKYCFFEATLSDDMEERTLLRV